MAKLQYARLAANNPILRVFISDSSKTDGSGLAGVAFNSTGLTIAVMRELDSTMTVYTAAGSTTETITTIGTYAAPTATKCRVKLVDDTNAPGLIEIHLAQALLGTGDGSRFLTGYIKGVTNMAPCLFEVQLVAYNPQEASLGILNLLNTGATYNTNNSVGKQIRQAAGNVPVAIRTGTCQTGSTANTIKLDSGASATNDIYVGCIVFLTGGVGLGQTRTIVAYNGTTKVATVDTNWITIPTNTSTFEIDASANSLVSNEGTAQAGGASTVTLATTASATNDLYNGSFVTVLSGTGVGQTRIITGYVGATKVATVDSAWSVQPDNTSAYAVIPAGNIAPPNTFTAPSAAEIVQTLLGSVIVSRDLSAVTAPTVQDSMAASVANAAGALAFTGLTLTLKFLDGSTLRAFAVDSATSPTSRT